jgi:hypothetical protein
MYPCRFGNKVQFRCYEHILLFVERASICEHINKMYRSVIHLRFVQKYVTPSKCSVYFSIKLRRLILTKNVEKHNNIYSLKQIL